MKHHNRIRIATLALLLLNAQWLLAQPSSLYRWVDSETSRHEAYTSFGQVANEEYVFDREHYFLNFGLNVQKLIYDEPDGPKMILSWQPQVNAFNTGLRSYRMNVLDTDIKYHDMRLSKDEYKTRLVGTNFIRIPGLFLLEQQIDEWDLLAFGSGSINLLTRRHTDTYIEWNDANEPKLKARDPGFVLQAEAGFGAGFRYNNQFRTTFHYHHVWHTITDDSKAYFESSIAPGKTPYYRYFDVNASIKILRFHERVDAWFNLAHCRFVESFDNSGFVRASIDFNWNINGKLKDEVVKQPNRLAYGSLRALLLGLDEVEGFLGDFKDDKSELASNTKAIIAHYVSIVKKEALLKEYLAAGFYIDDDMSNTAQRLLAIKEQLEELLILSAKQTLIDANSNSGAKTLNKLDCISKLWKSPFKNDTHLDSLRDGLKPIKDQITCN